MGTPLAVDQYSRYMASLFDGRDIIGVSTVGQSFFGRPEHGSRTIYSPDAKVVEIDIIRGSERVAALIQRGTTSKHLDNKDTQTQNFTSFSRVYPLAEEVGHITADHILNRVAGENPYAGRSKIDRMRELAREHHVEQMRRLIRLFEYLSWQSLLTGKQPAIIGTTNSDLIYDFRRNASLAVTPAVAWDAAGADILGDLDTWSDLLRTNGKVSPNFMLVPGDVSSAIIKDTTVQALADNRGFNLISVSPGNPVPANLQPLVAGGATALGRVFTPAGREIWVFTYVDEYTNSSGTATKYLPASTVLLGYYGARCDRYFGPPELLPVDSQKAAWYQELFGMNMASPPMPPNVKNSGAVINAGMFYHDAYKSEDGKKIAIRTQSAPIFATTQTDAFLVASNVLSVTS